MSNPLPEQLQSSLGDAYRLERALGGGMASVFLAHDTALGRPVVVKTLAPSLGADLSAERFAREIQLAARLQHPHVVPVLTAGVADGVPYYVMPFVEGASVRDRLRDAPHGVPLAEAVSILRDVARALDYAHAQGVVHRDVKPENVLLCRGSASVTDFGIAKALDRATHGDVDAALPVTSGSGITRVGQGIGTPGYMAPEQIAGDPALDHRADLYAFGVLAFELLCGAPPFAAATVQGLLAATLAGEPLPLAARRPDVPPALASLVARCLEKEPRNRPRHWTPSARAAPAVRAHRGGAGSPPRQRCSSSRWASGRCSCACSCAPRRSPRRRSHASACS